MALIKSVDVPKNAVVLDERDAASFQWNHILSWPKQGDVWAFKYGLGAISGSAAITALYIAKFYRRKFKLRDQGYIATLFTSMVAPSITAGVLHSEFITNNLLLFKTPCPVCLQTRAALIQVTAGIIYPLTFSPIMSTLVALQSGIRVPHYTQPRELMKMWSKFSKPLVVPILIMTGIHIILGMGITYFEQRQFYELHQKLLAYERTRVKKIK